MAWNHVPLKRGSQRKSTSRKDLPSLGPGRRVVDHVVTWRSHTAAVLLATAPLAPATPGHLFRGGSPVLFRFASRVLCGGDGDGVGHCLK